MGGSGEAVRARLVIAVCLAVVSILVGAGAASAGAEDPSSVSIEATPEASEEAHACTPGVDAASGEGSTCPSPQEEGKPPDVSEAAEAGAPTAPQAGVEATDEGSASGEAVVVQPGILGGRRRDGSSEGVSVSPVRRSGGDGVRNGSVQAPQPSAPSGPDRPQHHASSGGTAGGSSEGAVPGAESQSSSSSLLAGASELTAGSTDIPTLLLPVYEACGSQYEIPWEVLAAINKVETDFGANLGDSTAGAEGWMQFLPSSWASWGVDGNGDGAKDPDDPVDAICAAARYLEASGGADHLYRAIYAYNHADWYVQKVLAQAREYARVPENLIASQTALAEGSTFPVRGGGSYSNEAGARALLRRSWLSESLEPENPSGQAGEAGGGATTRIQARSGRVVVAVAGGTVRATGRSAALGRYVVLEDAYGDRFVYSELGSTSAKRGERVAAGSALGRVGSTEGGGGVLGFSVRPSGSASVDAVPLLDAWKRGGAGKIYGVAAEHPLAEDVSSSRVLLMSAPDLRRRVLADSKLSLPACERQAIAAGRVERRTMAALEFLTAEGFELGLAKSSCSSRVGFKLEIARIDGESVDGDRGDGATARSLLRRARALQGGLAAQRLGSTSDPASARIASDGGGAGVTLDFYPPQTATLVDGQAVAPVDAPAAVQEMIAAANQISSTPYVWGGGHGSWVSEGYDCSGAVSYVLHAAGLLSTPLTSGALESWGSSGAGRWVTVYANATHTYAVIAGLRWDTAGDASGSGPRWHDAPAYPEGFAVRHPAGY